MTTKPPVPSVEDKVVDVSSIGILPTNLGRWKSARVAPTWLVESIRDLGLLQAPVVRPAGFPLDPPNKDYILVIGEKRMLALRELGASVARVSVRTFESPEHAHAAAIAENIDRDELTLHDEMQVVVRYAKTTRRDVGIVARDLRMSVKRVNLYLKAHSQMAPDLMKDMVAIQSRAHAVTFLTAAARTARHEEQRAMVYGDRVPAGRARKLPHLIKALQIVQTSEVLTLKMTPKLRRIYASMPHLEPHQPLSPRERALVTLILKWTTPGSGEHFPLLGERDKEVREALREGHAKNQELKAETKKNLEILAKKE